MYYLPKTEKLGNLELIKTYSFYDVPRLFIVFSKKLNKNYLVHWADEEDTADIWYYVAINNEEIERVEQSKIQIRDVFLYKSVIKIVTPFDEDKEAKFSVLNNRDIDIEALPPFGFSITKDSLGNFNLIEKKIEDFYFNDNQHEIRIFHKKPSKKIEWQPVQRIINSWSNLYDSITASLKLKDTSLVPQAAETGSYKVLFSANHNSELLVNSINLFNYIKKNEIQKLINTNFNLEAIEDLLSALKEYGLKFEIRSNTGATLSVIDFEEIDNIEEKITEYNQTVIPSSKVPQADELSRLITFVKKISENQPFTAETENITPRQINYYKTAAGLLGLIKSHSLILTPLGWKLANTDSTHQAYDLLAESFENSECGWAWLKYDNKKKIIEVNPETATNFLLEKSMGLSEATAKRRASTLRRWIEDFKTYL
ncbi:DUF6575 domain-containing protein [Chimaeribacter arupi]|uniref:DUF6575 domain-containing protein n=1 Tax=Chimaeribacter arupi TaxID=2060066 RepID=UPI0011AF9FE8|nr:DUF6575 domain-containing protein [Chimaeribacter arupi]